MRLSQSLTVNPQVAFYEPCFFVWYGGRCREFAGAPGSGSGRGGEWGAKMFRLQFVEEGRALPPYTIDTPMTRRDDTNLNDINMLARQTP